MHENVSGTWKQITSAAENVSGTWKTITQGWENVSGTWKQFYSSATINTSLVIDIYREVSGTTSYCGMRLNNDGTVHGNNASGTASFSSPTSEGSWLSSGSASDVWVEYTTVTGTPNWLNEIGAGTRVNLGTSRRMGVSRTTGFGADSFVCDFNFYDAASGGNLIGTITAAAIVAARTT
jgi:hypothetical protein